MQLRSRRQISRQKSGGILPVEGFQFRVELRLSFFEHLGLLEEALRCDCEELGGIGGAVFIEHGGAPYLAIPLEPFVFSLENAPVSRQWRGPQSIAPSPLEQAEQLPYLNDGRK
jgi:hypothetical protein